MALLCHEKNLGRDKSFREVLHVFYLSAFIVSSVIRYFLLQFRDNHSNMKRSEKLKNYIQKEISGIKVSVRTEGE